MRKLNGYLWLVAIPILSLLLFPISYGYSSSTANQFACLNNNICDAIDFGTSSFLSVLGDASQGIYDNTCGTNADEPNPWSVRAFWNDAGVWFTFTTDDNPGPLVVVDGISDPENAGNPLDLEIAIYKQLTASCNGGMQFITGYQPINNLDARALLRCPEPNTTYYIIVDGIGTFAGGPWGNFGIEVYQPDVSEAGDLICEADYLGAVPEGGTIDSDGAWSNFCATGTGDPHAAAFNTQVGVWFEFTAPPSGHVIVDGFADESIFPLGVQLAVFGTDDGTCNGSFVEFGSNFSGDELDETLEVTCLQPNQNYWVLIDGFGSGGIGIFSLTIRDAGDITPRTTVETTICAGDSLIISNSIYTASGSYADTINLYEGCDSLIFTNLRVLEPIDIQIEQLEPAMGLGAENGSARAIVTGGSGNYQIDWSNGESGEEASSLTGNTECCVNVVDDLGCFASFCFTVNLVTLITSQTVADTLDCFGDQDAVIKFSVADGIGPYSYSWNENESGLSGEGIVDVDGEFILLESLPGGIYSFLVNDGFGEVTFDIVVVEPSEIELSTLSLDPVSCFGACDGKAELAVSGGTGNLRFNWGQGTMVDEMIRNNLCAGNYNLEVEDEKGCKETMELQVTEPAEFIVSPIVDQQVSCYEGEDGQAHIVTNGNPIAFNWSNGLNQDSADALSAGNYEITVTNEDGCQTIGRLEITEPESPVEAAITIEQNISCNGDRDGALLASVVGPGQRFQYRWSHGASTPTVVSLSAGEYGVTVVNEKGCEASDVLSLRQPEPLEADLEVSSITCQDELDGGSIRVTMTGGGTPDYEYSIDGQAFQSNPNFFGLTEGAYAISVKDIRSCQTSLEASVEGPPEVSVDLGNDLAIFLGDSLELAPYFEGQNLTFSWFVNGEPFTNGPLSVHVKPFATANYAVEILDTLNQCRARDDVRIVVDKKRRFFAPTAFSPNGDNNNDRFLVFGGQDVEQIKTFRVFDRYGNLMHEAFNFYPGDEAMGWDGTFKGQVLPTGVYVYFAEVLFIDRREEVFKGEIALIR